MEEMKRTEPGNPEMTSGNAASGQDAALSQNSNQNPIQVAERLFGALEYLVRNGQSSLTELTQALHLNKSTTHRILASLQCMDYVRQDPESGRYEATFKLVDLAGCGTDGPASSEASGSQGEGDGSFCGTGRKRSNLY